MHPCMASPWLLFFLSAAFARDDDAWMINVTRRGMDAGAAGFPPLTAEELSALESKAAGWAALAAEHTFWGQAFPEVVWVDAARSAPTYFDDVGDTAAWTGTLLAALAHRYAAETSAFAFASAATATTSFSSSSSSNLSSTSAFLSSSSSSSGAANDTLAQIRQILDHFDYATNCTGAAGYVPRSLALQPPSTGGASAAYDSWAAYFGADALPDPAQNVWACENQPLQTPKTTNDGSDDGSDDGNDDGDGGVWLWQGDSSRDMYIGTLFGLASALLQLPASTEAGEGRMAGPVAAAAAAARAQAQVVFERIFDRLSGDGFWIVPPRRLVQPGQLPVRPTPGLRAAFLRVALTANPAKYAAAWAEAYYGTWLPAAVATDKVTPMHRSGYYGNNLLSMTWYVTAAFELAEEPQRGGSPGTDADSEDEDSSGSERERGQGSGSLSASTAAGAVVRKVGRLLNVYAPHLQANLNGYMAALQPNDDGGDSSSGAGWSSGSNATAAAADPALPFAAAAATLWDAPAAPDNLHAVDRSHCNVTDRDFTSAAADTTRGRDLETSSLASPSPSSWSSSSSSSSASSSAAVVSSCYYGAEVSCAQSCNCSETALLVRDRPQSEFLWQVDPTKLSGGSDHAPASPATAFGGAFLAPYWVLRAGGLLTPPQVAA